MRRGLNGAGDGLLFIIKINKNNQQKLPRRGKTGQLAGLARQDRVGEGRGGEGRGGDDKARQD